MTVLTADFCLSPPRNREQDDFFSDSRNKSEARGKNADELCFILPDRNSLSLKDIFEQLGIVDKINVPSEPNHKGIENTVFHFDPEIQEIEGGRVYATFDQSGAASSHLLSNGIGAGDVFLFFGIFKKLCLKTEKSPMILRCTRFRQSGAI
ncbi:MAG: hypothetical protein IJ191_01005 [Treponema sp.]|nr:hypothetical protein [Treponema sp.]